MPPVLRALTQRHLDLAFRTGGDLDVRIVEFPGRWMPPDDLARLTADLRAVAARTLPAGDLTYGVFSGDPDRLRQTVLTVIRRGGRPVAFNALVVIPTTLHGRPAPVLHLGLVMVDPGERSRGLSWILYGLTCALIFLREGMRPVRISNVTQVPAVVGLVAETFSGVFPAPDRTELRNFDTLLLARAIMADHRHVFGVGPEARFDEARFVIEDAYTGGSDHLKKTLADAQPHRDPAYAAFCADRLDYDRGDDLLQIGALDMGALRRWVLREVPKGSLPAVAALGSLVLLRRAVLPVWHWATPGRAFGALRPAR